MSFKRGLKGRGRDRWWLWWGDARSM